MKAMNLERKNFGFLNVFYVEDNPVMGIDNRGDILCKNYVLSWNVGVPSPVSIRGVPIGFSGEYGFGVLFCKICKKYKCYSYEFACAGGGLGLPASGTTNFEWGWWRGGSVSDFSGFGGQISGNASLLVGGSISGIGSLSGGYGETSGISGGIAGGVSFSFCWTWNLREIDCNKTPIISE